MEIYILLYAYFFFGPALASLLGYEVYSGIDLRYLQPAISVFLISILALLIGLLVPGLKFKSRDFALMMQPGRNAKEFVYIPAMLICLGIILYSYYVGALFSYENKVVKISRVGIYHYAAITLVPCVLICYMALFDSQRGRHWGFSLCIMMYCFYSFMMSERDFLLFFLPVYFWCINRTRSGYIYPAIMSVILTAVFVVMSLSKSDVMSQGAIGSFLNQGSNLMVITVLLAYLDGVGEPIYGLSYLSATINAVTFGFVRLWSPCSVWLSNYFSGGAGAYGFSLEAEAFFNFGFVGVFVFFFILARYYRCVERLADSGARFGMLLYYHFLFFFMYSIRGEFLIILKSLMYCLILYFIVLAILGRAQIAVSPINGGRRG
ncbi:MAG: hypothetical protein ACK4SX_04260 [Alcanivoracaceae bacterium]